MRIVPCTPCDPAVVGPTGPTGPQPILCAELPLEDGAVAEIGVMVEASPCDHVHPRTSWEAVDYDETATWTSDPADATTFLVLPTAGTLYTAKVHFPVEKSIGAIQIELLAPGINLTAGQCKASIYQGGVLLGTTVDQAAAWATDGPKPMSLTAPVLVPAGDVDIAIWFNGDVGPAVLANAAKAPNMALADPRFATADTGVTTTAPAVLGAKTALDFSLWCALLPS